MRTLRTCFLILVDVAVTLAVGTTIFQIIDIILGIDNMDYSSIKSYLMVYAFAVFYGILVTLLSKAKMAVKSWLYKTGRAVAW